MTRLNILTGYDTKWDMIQMSKTKDHLARHTAFRFLAKHSWVDSAQPMLMIHQLFQKKRNVAELILKTEVQKTYIYLLIEDTLGTFSWSHTPSAKSLSLISQANRVIFSFLYLQIALTTLGVATLGLDPPIILGRIEPVSWNLEYM